MIEIKISDEIKKVCPNFRGAAVIGNVKNTAYNELLLKQIESNIIESQSSGTLEDIKKNPAIAATRDAYKKLGKDPNRYRPSAEALCRRIIRQLPLYQINTLVDIINLVSIKTGYSIGGFDMNKMQGHNLILGIGNAEEPYEAIGRGAMNIEGLPVYRDAIGGIGTPTSDHERTKIDIHTTQLLIIINGYNGKEGLDNAVEYMIALLRKFADYKEQQIIYF